MLHNISGNMESFVNRVGEGLDLDILDLSDPKVIDSLVHYSENFDNTLQLRLICTLCSHLDSKKSCAGILNAFTKDMLSQQVVRFIHEVISHTFFLDLRGDMNEFIKGVSSDVRAELNDYLHSVGFINENGKIVEASDEDEDGNLVGFVVDDNNIIYDTDAGSEVSEETVSSVTSSAEKHKRKNKKHKKDDKSNKRRRIIDEED